jgi:hypothetical protein
MGIWRLPFDSVRRNPTEDFLILAGRRITGGEVCWAEILTPEIGDSSPFYGQATSSAMEKWRCCLPKPVKH